LSSIVAHYPFLDESLDWFKEEGITLQDLAQAGKFAGARDLGLQRLEASLAGEPWQAPGVAAHWEIQNLALSYVWARVLLAAMAAGSHSRRKAAEMGLRYFALAEAIRAQGRIRNELQSDSERLQEVAGALGLDVRKKLTVGDHYFLTEDYWIHFLDYLKGSVHIRDKSWKLINAVGVYLEIFDAAGELTYEEFLELPLKEAERRFAVRRVTGMVAGWLMITPRRLERLLRELIRVRVEGKLPVVEDLQLLQELKPTLEQLEGAIKSRQSQAMSGDLGEVTLTRAPPCIRILLGQTTTGINVSHHGRFALTTFLHHIGMDHETISALYSTSPDYNPDIAEYQVQHILDHEYTPPGCDTMRTNGNCPGRSAKEDPLCEKVHHPLSYYRKKQTRARVTVAPKPVVMK